MELGDNFMPLNTAFLERIQPQDRFVLAFPRSGSRWLCYALVDLVNQWQGIDLTHYYHLHESVATGTPETIPFSGYRFATTIPDVHGTETPPSLLSGLIGVSAYRSHHLTEVLRRSQGRKVYVVRHPAPAIFSYYAFVLAGGWIAPEVTFEEFLSWKLPLWVDHVETMLSYHRTNPGTTLFLAYQDQGPLTQDQIGAAAAALGIPATEGMISQAWHRMRKFLDFLNALPQKAHTRGTNGAVAAQISPALLGQIEATAGPVLAEALRVAEATCLSGPDVASPAR